jgi:hypothetical protein
MPWIMMGMYGWREIIRQMDSAMLERDLERFDGESPAAP